MSEVYTYNATHLTTIREGSVELTQSADGGEVGMGRFAIDDTDGTLEIVGHKDFSVTQSACSVPLTFRGYIGDRSYGRSAGVERAPHTGAARGISVTVTDVNAMLGFRLIDALDGKRPAETVAQRGAWLLGSSYVSGLFVDNGRCDFPDYDMDKADYRHQFPGDVLGDMGMAALGFNHYIADWGSGPELTFRNDNTSTADSSTVRISNVRADVDSDPTTLGPTRTFGPSTDATLERSSGFVASKLSLSYAKGTVIEERTDTATAFNGERGLTASNSNIKTAAMASTEADAMLSMHRTEEDILTCTLTVPDSAVNLILQGQRIQAKFSHLDTEGYGSFTWFRILDRTVRPIVADGELYELDLTLSPQEPNDGFGPGEEPAEECGYANTPSDIYYPLGGPIPTASDANPSDGVVFYYRSGLPEPTTPTPGYLGKWHFPFYSVGGPGTIDYASNCVQNQLRLLTVGNGTWTIQTETQAGLVRELRVLMGPPGVFTEVTTILAGGSVEVTIDDTTDLDCIRVTIITDQGVEGPCPGGRWGWSEAEWDSGGAGGAGPPPGGGSGGSTGTTTFDLATGSTLNPLVEPVYGPGDPGFGLDSDFMGNLSKVSVSGGVTRITATKVGSVWQSACIGTNGTFSQLYGEFEARIKYPTGMGVWPAFWLLAPGVPATPPEIDVLEAYPGAPMLGTPGQDFISATLHSAGPVQTVQYDTGSDNTEEYHNYRMVWRAGSLKFYYDGVLILSTTTNVPAVAMYPILNLALGATGYRTDGTTPTTLVMDIAHMRVYA